MTHNGIISSFTTELLKTKSNQDFNNRYKYGIACDSYVYIFFNIESIKNFKQVLKDNIFNKPGDIFEVYVLFNLDIIYHRPLHFHNFDKKTVDLFDIDLEIQDLNNALSSNISEAEKGYISASLNQINDIYEVQSKLSEYFGENVFINSFSVTEDVTNKMKLNIGIPLNIYDRINTIRSNTNGTITVNNLKESLKYFHFRIYNTEEYRFSELHSVKDGINLDDSKQLISQFSKYS